MTKDEALRLIAEGLCFAEAGRAALGASDKDCRTLWPAETSEWCPSCIARQSIDEAEGTVGAVRPLKICGCDAVLVRKSRNS